MKNHTVTIEEITAEYKIQLAAQVDANLGKKALIANVVPGQKRCLSGVQSKSFGL